MNSQASANLLAYVSQHAPIIENYLEKLAVFGAQPEGGLIRPVYSPPWLAAQQQLADWMKEVGLTVRTDAIGNLWGRAEGLEAGGAIASGSHLDTVKGGGKYDGALGIIAALCAIRFLKENFGQSRLPLEVLAFCEEEGSRFSNTFLGSRAIVGSLTAEELTENLDTEGISIFQAAQACGYAPDKLPTARREGLGGFLELHIEQGSLLDHQGVQIGAVRAITGLQHAKAIFRGRADHAGTTPMDLRADALVAAAEAIVQINQFVRSLEHPAVATVGTLSVLPGARNIVPATVEFSIDFRHSDNAIRATMEQEIRQICFEAGQKHGVEVEIEKHVDRSAAQMSPQLVDLIQESANQLGLSNMVMVSGAGHDSQIMVEAVPTAMIFVPSRAGRSHSSAEYTPIEEIVPGVAVLAQALYKLAY